MTTVQPVPSGTAPEPPARQASPDAGTSNRGTPEPGTPAAHTSDPGTITRITAGPYSAEIGTRGAALRLLTHRGRDLVVRSTPELSPLAYSGRVLAPWPNRIAGAAYRWQGRDYQLEVTEPSTGSAIHGLVCWTEFRITALESNAVALTTTIADAGYPSVLSLTVRYQLDAESGLRTEITATNEGTVSAPYGVSVHPYLVCGGAPLGECELTLPATRVLTSGSPGVPAVVTDVGGDLDLREPARFGDRRIDHAYTGLPAAWEALLRDPATGFGVSLGSDSPWAQVYSGEETGRAGAAVEPMTCPPDAFNSGTDVIELVPGQHHRFAFTLRALETE